MTKARTLESRDTVLTIFRTKADSITDNKAKPSGGRKKFNKNSIEI